MFADLMRLLLALSMALFFSPAAVAAALLLGLAG